MNKTFEPALKKYAEKVIEKVLNRDGKFTKSELKTLHILINTWGVYTPLLVNFPDKELAEVVLDPKSGFQLYALMGRVVQRVLKEMELALTEAKYGYACLSDVVKQCSALELSLDSSANAPYPLTKEEYDELTNKATKTKRGMLITYEQVYADIVCYLRGEHFNCPKRDKDETGKEIPPSEALKIVETYKATDGKGHPLSERVSREREEVTYVCKSDPSIRVDMANVDSSPYRACFVEEWTNKFLLEKVMQPVAKTRREIEKLAGYKLSCSDADIDAYMTDEFMSYTDLKLTVEDRRALIAYRESIPSGISHADIKYEWDSIPEERSPRTLYDCLKTVGTEKDYPDSANDPVLFFADEVKKYFPELDRAITQYIAETTPQLMPNGSITLSELNESNSVAGVWHSLTPTNSEILGELPTNDSFEASLYHTNTELRHVAVSKERLLTLGYFGRMPYSMRLPQFIPVYENMLDQAKWISDEVLPSAFKRLSELESVLYAVLQVFGESGIYKAMPRVETLVAPYNALYEDVRYVLFERVFGNVEERHKSLERYRTQFQRFPLPAKNAKLVRCLKSALTDIKEKRVEGRSIAEGIVALIDSDIKIESLDFVMRNRAWRQ